MRAPVPGDRVVHVYRTDYNGIADTYIIGNSNVSRPVREVADEPPSPGDWGGMSPYYRIDLDNYVQFRAPLPIRRFMDDYEGEIRADLTENSPRFYPFNTHGAGLRTVQGIYLARSTPDLDSLLEQALGIETADGDGDTEQRHREYTESRRQARERYFFARNPVLAREAKRLYGHQCCACGFCFLDRYGDLGRDFIEVHHVDQLAERSELEWTDQLRTTVDRVAVVCSNCHRMLHRRRPAYTIEELRKSIRPIGL